MPLLWAKSSSQLSRGTADETTTSSAPAAFSGRCPVCTTTPASFNDSVFSDAPDLIRKPAIPYLPRVWQYRSSRYRRLDKMNTNRPLLHVYPHPLVALLLSDNYLGQGYYIVCEGPILCAHSPFSHSYSPRELRPACQLCDSVHDHLGSVGPSQLFACRRHSG